MSYNHKSCNCLHVQEFLIYSENFKGWPILRIDQRTKSLIFVSPGPSRVWGSRCELGLGAGTPALSVSLLSLSSVIKAVYSTKQHNITRHHWSWISCSWLENQGSFSFYPLKSFLLLRCCLPYKEFLDFHRQTVSLPLLLPSSLLHI